MINLFLNKYCNKRRLQIVSEFICNKFVTISSLQIVINCNKPWRTVCSSGYSFCLFPRFGFLLQVICPSLFFSALLVHGQRINDASCMVCWSISVSVSVSLSLSLSVSLSFCCAFQTLYDWFFCELTFAIITFLLLIIILITDRYA